METCKPSERGMVIEPLSVYLNNLPDKDNVIKINAAFLFGGFKKVPVYYIKPEIIKEHGLFDWMRGCNSVAKPHDFHLNYFKTIEEFNEWGSMWRSGKLPIGRNLLEEGLVSIDTVPCVTFAGLVKDHGIKNVKYIKVDTEGMDADIVHSILDDLWTMNRVKLPSVIQFETNAHNDTKKSIDLINRLIQIGYKIYVGSSDGDKWVPLKDTIYTDCKAVINYK